MHHYSAKKILRTLLLLLIILMGLGMINILAIGLGYVDSDNKFRDATFAFVLIGGSMISVLGAFMGFFPEKMHFYKYVLLLGLLIIAVGVVMAI